MLILGNGDECSLFSGAGPFLTGVYGEAFYSCAHEVDEYFGHTVNMDNPILDGACDR